MLTIRLDAIASLAEVTAYVRAWLHTPQGRYICLANAHTCMEAQDEAVFRRLINRADLVLPDGRPLLWGLKLWGRSTAIQVRGFDLMLTLLDFARRHHVPVGFMGGGPEDLKRLRKKLERDFPDLDIACMLSPPFSPLTETEDAALVEDILRSGARIVFVFLGCPKQERWMAAHRDRLPCIMIGAGAALDFYTGNKKQAPRFVQRLGFEWLFRLLCEPRRLWKRYAKHHPRFMKYFFLQWLKLSYKRGLSFQALTPFQRVIFFQRKDAKQVEVTHEKTA